MWHWNLRISIEAEESGFRSRNLSTVSAEKSVIEEFVPMELVVLTNTPDPPSKCVQEG